MGKEKKHIARLSYGFYFSIVMFVALIGLVDSVYLSISHYRVYTDIGYKSICAISRSFNCDTVSQSPYSIFLGVPVPVMGIMGYSFFLALLFFAWPRKSTEKRIWTLLMFISLFFSVYSIVLAAISTFYISSYCIMCILTYAVNFILLYFSWLIRRRFNAESIAKALYLDIRYLRTYVKSISTIISIFVIIFVLLFAFFPNYWQLTKKSLFKSLAIGVTEEGYPWIGAENPSITIMEFSDYLCFQCNKMHSYIRQIIERYPDSIRLIHRHFPMDSEYNPLVDESFHVGSGKMAIIALYAQEKGEFWKINDVLFELGSSKKDFNTKTIAEKMNISGRELSLAMKSKFLRFKLKHDIAVGIDMGITGTPGFVIDGEVYLGTIPKEFLEKLDGHDE